MGLVVLVVGMIGVGAVIGFVVVFGVLRSRRNSRPGRIGRGVGTYPQDLGYPPEQQIYQNPQRAYPSNPNHGYPNQRHPMHPAQQPQQSNPYGQQPPYQGH